MRGGGRVVALELSLQKPKCKVLLIFKWIELFVQNLVKNCALCWVEQNHNMRFYCFNI